MCVCYPVILRFILQFQAQHERSKPWQRWCQGSPWRTTLEPMQCKLQVRLHLVRRRQWRGWLQPEWSNGGLNGDCKIIQISRMLLHPMIALWHMEDTMWLMRGCKRDPIPLRRTSFRKQPQWQRARDQRIGRPAGLRPRRPCWRRARWSRPFVSDLVQTNRSRCFCELRHYGRPFPRPKWCALKGSWPLRGIHNGKMLWIHWPRGRSRRPREPQLWMLSSHGRSCGPTWSRRIACSRRTPWTSMDSCRTARLGPTEPFIRWSGSPSMVVYNGISVTCQCHLERTHPRRQIRNRQLL